MRELESFGAGEKIEKRKKKVFCRESGKLMFIFISSQFITHSIYRSQTNGIASRGKQNTPKFRTLRGREYAKKNI